MLFSTTIRENILYGARDPASVTEEQLRSAVQQANAAEFIDRCGAVGHGATGTTGRGATLTAGVMSSVRSQEGHLYVVILLLVGLSRNPSVFVRSFIHAIHHCHSLIQLLMHSFHRPFNHSFIHSYVHSSV